MAALLAEMEEVGCPRTLRELRDGVPSLKVSPRRRRGSSVGRVAKYALRKAETKGKVTGWRVAFGGEGDDEYLLSGVMSADNYWLLSDDKEKLTWTVNDIIEDLLNLDMEPKQESLWCLSAEKKMNGR